MHIAFERVRCKTSPAVCKLLYKCCPYMVEFYKHAEEIPKQNPMELRKSVLRREPSRLGDCPTLQGLEISHFAPQGLASWGMQHFYRHSDPQGLRSGASKLVFL